MTRKNLHGVSYIPQKINYCGQAALASYLQFLGRTISQEEIGQRTPGTEYFGTRLDELESIAKEEGFHAEISQRAPRYNGFY